MTLVVFEGFRQINILTNSLFQQIAKYYIHQYLSLYGITTINCIILIQLVSFYSINCSETIVLN